MIGALIVIAERSEANKLMCSVATRIALYNVVPSRFRSRRAPPGFVACCVVSSSCIEESASSRPLYTGKTGQGCAADLCLSTSTFPTKAEPAGGPVSSLSVYQPARLFAIYLRVIGASLSEPRIVLSSVWTRCTLRTAVD